jgi:formate dehydrogenase major subunit
VPDFDEHTPPDYTPAEGAKSLEALSGTDPFIMQSDGKGWLYVPSGLADGPLPAHYEPHESPVRNTLYGQQASPARRTYDRPENLYNTSARFRYVFTTSRLTEHHTAGAMSRSLPYLAELQPELFCEVSPELADEVGLVNGGWATVVTARTAIEVRVLVTARVRPLRLGNTTVHQIVLPYHWGYGGGGLVTGDIVNDLVPIVLDPNVYIQESKVATCDVRPGRRPRGKALLELMERYRHG